MKIPSRSGSVLGGNQQSAALNVVKSRLEEAGLGDFCLELHSHKSQKKKLLENLDARMKGKYRVPSNIISKRNSLVEKRRALRQYAETLNMVLGNELGKTVFEVLWAADNRRGRLGAAASAAERITLAFAVNTPPEQLTRLLANVEGLSRHFEEIRSFGPEHPWYGFYPTTHPAGLALDVKDLLDQQSSVARDLQEKTKSICEGLRLKWNDASSCRGWVELASVLDALKPPPDVPPGMVAILFAQGQPLSVRAVLEELRDRIDRVRALEKTFSGNTVQGATVTEPEAESARRHVSNLEQFHLASRKVILLREAVPVMRALAVQISEAMRVLREVSEIAGLSWGGADET